MIQICKYGLDCNKRSTCDKIHLLSNKQPRQPQPQLVQQKPKKVSTSHSPPKALPLSKAPPLQALVRVKKTLEEKLQIVNAVKTQVTVACNANLNCSRIECNKLHETATHLSPAANNLLEKQRKLNKLNEAVCEKKEKK